MKPSFCLLIILGLHTYCNGQNLLGNGDFEQYSKLPDNAGQIQRAIGWSKLNNGPVNYFYGTPDYFHLLATNKYCRVPNSFYGTIIPYSGSACAGFLSWHGFLAEANKREYISTQLLTPLKKNKRYRVSFQLANGDNNYYTWGTNNIGVYLSMDSLKQNSIEVIQRPVNYSIDTIFYSSSWKEISFDLIADTSYRFISFGNFSQDASTQIKQMGSGSDIAYYFIDDIRVFEPDSIPGLLSEPVLSFPNIFTPNADGINDLFLPHKMEGILSAHLQIYNRWGAIVFEGTEKELKWDGKNGAIPCTEGVYFWMANYIGVNSKQESLKGNIMLIR